MAGFYDELQGTVREVMAEFGQGAVYYVAVVPGNGPIDDPGSASQTLYKIDAAVRGVSVKYVQMGLAVASDLQLTASVSNEYIPDMKGKIQVDGLLYKIKQIIKVPAAGTPVAYTFIFSRGD